MCTWELMDGGIVHIGVRSFPSPIRVIFTFSRVRVRMLLRGVQPPSQPHIIDLHIDLIIDLLYSLNIPQNAVLDG